LKILESVYPNLSNERWVFVLMQIYKIFIRGKSDPDCLASTPGLSDGIKESQLISSRFSTFQELMAGINLIPNSL
jgi:hypothetical protein